MIAKVKLQRKGYREKREMGACKFLVTDLCTEEFEPPQSKQQGR